MCKGFHRFKIMKQYYAFQNVLAISNKNPVGINKLTVQMKKNPEKYAEE